MKMKIEGSTRVALIFVVWWAGCNVSGATRRQHARNVDNLREAVNNAFDALIEVHQSIPRDNSDFFRDATDVVDIEYDDDVGMDEKTAKRFVAEIDQLEDVILGKDKKEAEDGMQQETQDDRQDAVLAEKRDGIRDDVIDLDVIDDEAINESVDFLVDILKKNIRERERTTKFEDYLKKTFKKDTRRTAAKEDNEIIKDITRNVEKRVTENDKRTAENDKRTTENDKRTTENDKRATENDKRTTEDDKRTTESDKRATEKEKRTTENDDKRAAENVKQTTDNDKQATKNEKRTTKNDKRENDSSANSDKSNVIDESNLTASQNDVDACGGAKKECNGDVTSKSEATSQDGERKKSQVKKSTESETGAEVESESEKKEGKVMAKTPRKHTFHQHARVHRHSKPHTRVHLKAHKGVHTDSTRSESGATHHETHSTHPLPAHHVDRNIRVPNRKTKAKSVGYHATTTELKRKRVTPSKKRLTGDDAYESEVRNLVDVILQHRDETKRESLKTALAGIFGILENKREQSRHKNDESATSKRSYGNLILDKLFE